MNALQRRTAAETALQKGTDIVNIRKIIKNYSFSILMILGLIVGALGGLIFGSKAKVVQPVADIFLNLVFTVIVPLIMVSITSAIANMSNLSKLGKIFGVMLAAIVAGGIVTSLLALAVGLIWNPAEGVHLDMSNIGVESAKYKASGSIDIVGMLTTNDFINLLSLKHMMPLIIFSMLMGVAAASIGEAAQPFKRFLSSATTVLTKVVEIIMYMAPVGIACYFASLVGNVGSTVVSGIIRLSIIYVLFCVCFAVLQGTLYAAIGAGMQGVKRYWTMIWPSLTMAMGTCSSSATISINQQVTHNMGVPDEIGNVTVPVGAMIHKNGVVAVQIFKIMFLFGIFGRSFTVKSALLAIVVAVISGVIVGTIPTGGFIGELFICSSFGFPTGVVPIIVIMGSLTDPFCTMTSVTSQPALSMTISRFTEGPHWLGKQLSMQSTVQQ